jgi:hypothetical protein
VITISQSVFYIIGYWHEHQPPTDIQKHTVGSKFVKGLVSVEVNIAGEGGGWGWGWGWGCKESGVHSSWLLSSPQICCMPKLVCFFSIWFFVPLFWFHWRYTLYPYQSPHAQPNTSVLLLPLLWYIISTVCQLADKFTKKPVNT